MDFDHAVEELHAQLAVVRELGASNGDEEDPLQTRLAQAARILESIATFGGEREDVVEDAPIGAAPAPHSVVAPTLTKPILDWDLKRRNATEMHFYFKNLKECLRVAGSEVAVPEVDIPDSFLNGGAGGAAPGPSDADITGAATEVLLHHSLVSDVPILPWRILKAHLLLNPKIVVEHFVLGVAFEKSVDTRTHFIKQTVTDRFLSSQTKPNEIVGLLQRLINATLLKCCAGIGLNLEAQALRDPVERSKDAASEKIRQQRY